MGLDPTAINEELKKARLAHVSAQVTLLTVEFNKKMAFEAARTTASSKTVDGKAPSEAACERTAKNDATYLKACQSEITATEMALKADILVEYLRKQFDVALAMVKP